MKALKLLAIMLPAVAMTACGGKENSEAKAEAAQAEETTQTSRPDYNSSSSSSSSSSDSYTDDSSELNMEDPMAGIMDEVNGVLQDPFAEMNNSSSSSSDNSSNTAAEPSAENAAASKWVIAGTYTFVDDSRRNFTLELKEGGKAILTDHNLAKQYPDEYEPMEGRWSEGDGFAELDFFEGPFVTIGDDEYIQNAILTDKALYHDRTEYNKGKAAASLKVTKK